jgi:hypothetical protein
MSLWWILLVVCAAGAVGGVVNALMSDNGFILPRKEKNDKVRIVRPGYLGNVLIGAVGAGVSWGLYGPFSSRVLLGGAQQAGTAQLPPAELSLAAFVGAVLVGVAGARVLTNEVDKRLLKAAASEAASKPASDDKAKSILMATPAQAFNLAKNTAS